jgi:hypothetical protein
MVSRTEGDAVPGYSERKDDRLRRPRRIEFSSVFVVTDSLRVRRFR